MQVDGNSTGYYGFPKDNGKAKSTGGGDDNKVKGQSYDDFVNGVNNDYNQFNNDVNNNNEKFKDGEEEKNKEGNAALEGFLDGCDEEAWKSHNEQAGETISPPPKDQSELGNWAANLFLNVINGPGTEEMKLDLIAGFLNDPSTHWPEDVNVSEMYSNIMNVINTPFFSDDEKKNMINNMLNEIYKNNQNPFQSGDSSTTDAWGGSHFGGGGDDIDSELEGMNLTSFNDLLKKNGDAQDNPFDSDQTNMYG